jgi:ribosomal protein S12
MSFAMALTAISIGSLGPYYGETHMVMVSGVHVRNVKLVNSYWGVRFKIYSGTNDTNTVSGGATRHVWNITFEDINNQSQ